MSELITNSSSYKSSLEEFAIGILEGKNGRMLMDTYRQLLDTVTPFETMQVLDALLLSGYSIDKVKACVGKILNAFYKSLSSYSWAIPISSHFLYYMMLENREVEKILAEVKLLNRQIFKGAAKDRPPLVSQLRLLMLRLKEYELHYIKKENILFSYIEKVFPQYRCLHIMWAFHNDFRSILKKINLNLEDIEPDYEQLNKDIGRLFFIVLPLIFREEQIIFPVAMKALPADSWDEMLQQSQVQGWCYIAPLYEYSGTQKGTIESGTLIDLGAGLLTPEQLKLIFNNSPMDITFIDEKDEVKYFSESKERIFPRSRAIIGRKVQNCHPPHSIHIVNEILLAFRNGEKDRAEFWIQVKGRFLYIRYLALRNDDGNYKGTLEITEDITDARSLVNERRLLKWEN